MRNVVSVIAGAVACASSIGCGAMKHPTSESELPAGQPLPVLLNIDWHEGPEYPLGIQDAVFAMVGDMLVSAGGVSRCPKEIVNVYPDAFKGQLVKGAPGGFTSLTFAISPRDPDAQWVRLPDIPGPARQAAATAVVGNALYAIGGFNRTDPRVYRDTYCLRQENGAWAWSKLPCELPWPICESAAVVIGEKIYLVGGADIHASPGMNEVDFNSEAGRNGEPVGRALLMLDTTNPEAGWKRLTDLPGVPRFNTTAAAAGGKIYALGGIHRGTKDGIYGYYNVVDSWVYDPSTSRWDRLPDMPAGSNRRAATYADRYILLVGGYKYEFTRNLDGGCMNAYSEKERALQEADRFEDTVLVFDTQTLQIGRANSLLDPSAFPQLAMDGNRVYSLGGEGGRRLFHPATFQVGLIAPIGP